MAYQDLMPNLNPLLRTLSQLTNFTLPVSQLRSIGQRAASEARTAIQPSLTELENIRRSLGQQRESALRAAQSQQELLPRLFQQNLGGIIRSVVANERQRGVQSGLSLRNILEAQTEALQRQAQQLGQSVQQQSGIIQDYLGQLFSRVFRPQLQLAQAQGSDAFQRYQQYLNAAYEALQAQRLQEAEFLLTQAQLEYNAAVLGAQNQLLAEQSRYQQQLGQAHAGYQQALRDEELGAQRRAISGSISGVPYSNIINRYARQYGVSPDLVARVIRAESSFNPRARSHA